jgi:hypothetical protein
MGKVRRRGGVVRVELEPEETGLLRSLVEQVAQLLDPGEPAAGADPLEQLVGMADASPVPPADPLLHRLLPDGYSADDAASQEFRRLTENDLRAAKLAALHRISSSLDAGERTSAGVTKLALDEATVEAWLPGLTDIRLSLATRMGIVEEGDRERLEAEPDDRLWELGLYDWLAWLQEELVHALAG